MRKNPSNQASIIDLLEKCHRNLKGIEMRTLDGNGHIDPVPFSQEDYKKVMKLLHNIQGLSSLVEERFLVPGKRERKPPVKRESEKLSAVQEYMRRYK